MASAATARQDLRYDGECSVTFPGFEERDVITGEIVFKWDADGIIPLSDSTMAFDPVEKRCTGGSWDFLLVSDAIVPCGSEVYELTCRQTFEFDRQIPGRQLFIVNETF